MDPFSGARELPLRAVPDGWWSGMAAWSGGRSGRREGGLESHRHEGKALCMRSSLDGRFLACGALLVMCLCVCARVRICLSVCVCLCICIYVFVSCLSVSVSVSLSLSLSISVSVSLSLCLSLYLSLCLCCCVCVCLMLCLISCARHAKRALTT